MDMTWALAGPFCSMILADLGAEVIKVENPEEGDPSRKNFPFIKGVSSYFLSVNRGKKSITVNLRHAKGKEIILGLARKSDILVENFRPGVIGPPGPGLQGDPGSQPPDHLRRLLGIRSDEPLCPPSGL